MGPTSFQVLLLSVWNFVEWLVFSSVAKCTLT